MRLTGRIAGVIRDFDTGKFHITFEADETQVVRDGIDELKGRELSITLGPARKRRSLDANAYAWVLMGGIAQAMRTSKEEVYELMLRRYGCFDLIDGGPITVTVRADVDMERIGGHWMRCRDSPDGKFAAYMKLLGSSRYDTAQMSAFIDGIISECRELGIETIPPGELERMVGAWDGSR